MSTKPATLAQILVTAVLTFLVLSLIVYALMYGQLAKVYRDWGRTVVQVECGRALPDQRLYALQPGICRFGNGEFDTRLVIDADGYRNDPSLMGSGRIEVAVTGDSHALGWGVADHETFAARLARRSELHVHNLAMSSYGTARELMTLTLLAKTAELVVIQYCDNDYRENAAFLADPDKFGQSEEVQRQLSEIFAKRDRTGIRWSRLWKATVMRGLGWLPWSWRMMGLPPREVGAALLEPQDLAREAEAFGRVLGHYRSYLAGRKVIVLESNNWGRLRPGFAAAFQAAAAANGLPHVRAVDASAALSRRDYLYLDEHLSAAGHAKLAALVYAAWTSLP